MILINRPRVIVEGSTMEIREDFVAAICTLKQFSNSLFENEPEKATAFMMGILQEGCDYESDETTYQ